MIDEEDKIKCMFCETDAGHFCSKNCLLHFLIELEKEKE